MWVMWDAHSTEVGDVFVSTPEFILWLMVIAAQAAVWVVLLLPVTVKAFQQGGRLRKDGTRWLLVPLMVLAVLCVFGVAAALTFQARIGALEWLYGTATDLLRDLPENDEWPLPDHRDKVRVLTGCASIVGGIALVGIGLAGTALLQMSNDRGTPSNEDVQRFVALRSDLNMLLAVAAVIIGLGTLASGLLREAVIATNEIELTRPPQDETQPFASVKPDDPATPANEARFRTNLKFDSQYVLLYGLLLSGLLAVAFTPSYLALRRAGQSLRDRTFELPGPTDPTFGDVTGKRKTMDEFLQTKLTALTSIKAGLAILSPLAGSLLALAIEVPH